MNTINSSFKASLSFKIVSLIVSVAFLCTNTVYGLDFSKSNSLRIPLMSVKRDTEQRSAIVSHVLQIFYERVSKKDEVVKDKTRLMPRILSKAKPIHWWLLVFSYVAFVCIFEDMFEYGPKISSLLELMLLLVCGIEPLFWGTMLLPIRLTFTFLKPAFYKTYYSKSPVERAEFILARLKEKAQKRGDKEILNVLSVLKGFRIVDSWPALGKVFDVPTGIMDITKGMTEQPAQLQYMIMRRVFDMWWLSQPKVRRNIVYYSDLRGEVSEFLIRHSTYIGIFLIYELLSVVIANGYYKFIKWFGIERPISRQGEANGAGDGVIYTVEQAVEEVVSGIAMGKNIVDDPGKFAERFYFSQDISIALLEILNSI